MSRVFVMDSMHTIGMNPASMASSHRVGLATSIGGRPVEFMFIWVPRSRYYVLEVVTDEDGVVAHLYPKAGEPLDLPGFAGNPESPDVSLLFLDTSASGQEMQPDTWADYQFIVAQGTIGRADQ